jgi:hypothetical protein
VVTKTHTVRHIAITEIDAATDVVRGTAAPSTEVSVAGDFSPFVRATANTSGQWVADLSGTCDIVLGWTQVRVSQSDEDFDATNVSQLAGTIAIPAGTSLTTPGHGTATGGVPTVWASDPLTVRTHGASRSR